MILQILCIFFIFFQQGSINSEPMTYSEQLVSVKNNKEMTASKLNENILENNFLHNSEARNRRQMTFYVPFDSQKRTVYNAGTRNQANIKTNIKTNNDAGYSGYSSSLRSTNSNYRMRYGPENLNNGNENLARYNSYSSRTQTKNVNPRRYSTLNGANYNGNRFVRRPISSGLYENNYRQMVQYSAKSKVVKNSPVNPARTTKLPKSSGTHKKFKPSFVMMK